MKNHPLDNWKENGVKSNGKVKVNVFVVDGKIIGGTSMPIIPTKNGITGGWFSLDGKSNENND